MFLIIRKKNGVFKLRKSASEWYYILRSNNNIKRENTRSKQKMLHYTIMKVHFKTKLRNSTLTAAFLSLLLLFNSLCKHSILYFATCEFSRAFQPSHVAILGFCSSYSFNNGCASHLL